MLFYELQVYKGGKWEFDSYFDDRGTAVSEAERLHASRRYNGIRVIEENYRDNSETSDCSVIFSRLMKTGGDWRSRVQRDTGRYATRETIVRDAFRAARANQRRGAAGRPRARTGSSGGRAAKRRNEASLYGLMWVALIIVLAGIAAMIGLQQIADFL